MRKRELIIIVTIGYVVAGLIASSSGWSTTNILDSIVVSAIITIPLLIRWYRKTSKRNN